MTFALLPVPGFSKVVDCQDAGLHLRLEINIRMKILNDQLFNSYLHSVLTVN